MSRDLTSRSIKQVCHYL